MSKKRDRNKGIESLNLAGDQPVGDVSSKSKSKDTQTSKAGGGRWLVVGAIAFLSIGALGAGLKFLEENAKQNKHLAAKDRSFLSSVNPFAAAPLPSGTPQLSREYLYAGQRLLVSEDKNATAVPPADLAIWRPSNGTWYVRNPANGAAWVTQPWGQLDDKPVAGDYDGDGTTDFSVFRPSNTTWYVIHSSTLTMHTYVFGNSTDLLAPADYDGDGKTDEAVFRQSNGTWYIHASTAGYYTDNSASSANDLPAPADYDGDGKADLAVFRTTDRKFYVKLSSDGSTPTPIAPNFNPTGADWEPVSADYDGDGKADYAVYNRNSGIWYIRSSMTGEYPTTPVSWGQTGDTPVPNDYDADGKCDYAVWRPGASATWYIVESANGYTQRTVQWGTTADIPVPAFYRR